MQALPPSISVSSAEAIQRVAKAGCRSATQPLCLLYLNDQVYWHLCLLISVASLPVLQVSMQALPPGVSVSIAEAILFVGKAVRVLQRPTGPLRSHELLPHSQSMAFAEALRRLQQQPVFDDISFEHTIEHIRSKVDFLLLRRMTSKLKPALHSAFAMITQAL